MSNQVVLVTKEGKQIGLEDKLVAHQKGLLHSAFSIMIYRETPTGREYLLQRRALSKYHSGGLWTNTCCSHPFPGEPFQIAAARRLYEELGITEPLNMQLSGSFYYRVELDNDLIEHEIDQVILCEASDVNMAPNPEEIMEWAWWHHDKISDTLATQPHIFTAWFKQVLAYC